MSTLTKKRKGSLPGAGFGMVGLVLTLAIVGVGGAIGGTALLGGSGDSGLGTGNGSPANKAYDIAAESTLETAQSAVETVATTSGYSGISASSLEFDEPSVKFTPGPTTSDTSVSVADSATGSTAPGQAPTLGGAVSPAGSVTLAAYSESTSGNGSCLFVWMTTGATWFGAEADQTSCTATAMASAPTAGTPSATSIGWGQTTFPNP